METNHVKRANDCVLNQVKFHINYTLNHEFIADKYAGDGAQSCKASNDTVLNHVKFHINHTLNHEFIAAKYVGHEDKSCKASKR